MTNRPNGTLYVGVTSDLARRAWPRAWKVRTILAQNPEWEDLYDQLA